jgi:hypothetical protein
VECHPPKEGFSGSKGVDIQVWITQIDNYSMKKYYWGEYAKTVSISGSKFGPAM